MYLLSTLGDTQMERDVLSEINQNNMSRYQWFVILICICLNIIDGFDVMVMAFTGHFQVHKLACYSVQVFLEWLLVQFFSHR